VVSLAGESYKRETRERKREEKSWKWVSESDKKRD
jgi:hypothetical protein